MENEKKIEDMQRIKSFTVDHMTLLPGVYVSREDVLTPDSKFHISGQNGVYSDNQLYLITTYDIRITRPNFEPVMNTGEIHTIEHIGATYLRNRDDVKSRVIYWGPMGCRTGFYLILAGVPDVEAVKSLMIDLFEFTAKFEGEIPGATPVECGNYSDMDLPAAKLRAEKYLAVLRG